MRKYDLFFASLILISCVLILSGTIVFTSGTEYKPDSALFFLIGGLFGLAGLCGFLIRRKEK